jgi:hypothetical protein
MALLLVVAMTGCGGSNNDGVGGGGGTGGVCVGTDCVPLGTSGDLKTAAGYAILAETAITTVPDSVVIGNIGLSPNEDFGAALASWSLTGVAADPYFDSAQVPAPYHVYNAGNTGGTTSVDLGLAVGGAPGGMLYAYNDAFNRVHSIPDATYLNRGTPTPGTLTDLTLVAGVYEWGSGVSIPTNLTLSGSATDVWIFKVNGNLTMEAAKSVILAGALPQNIFWQVSGYVDIGANSHFEGIILSAGYIAFGNHASINGRLLSQTAVNLDMTTVTQP